MLCNGISSSLPAYVSPRLHSLIASSSRSLTALYTSTRCTSPSPSPQLWEKASRAKGIVLNLWRTSNTGLRVAAIKAIQRIVQSQTKGTADPRLQNRGDINLAMCPSHHPFLRSQQLEEEANKLVEEAFTQLYVSKYVIVKSCQLPR